MTLFIGDVHGKYGPYKTILKDHIRTIQVGDMGVGFIDPHTEKAMPNPPHHAMVKDNHRFIRGNHDNPAVCREHSQWIKDGTVEGEVMFIGGATSIDREWRIKDYTWWQDEELSVQDLHTMLNIYHTTRPRVMVTHECPEVVAERVLAAYNMRKFEDRSATRQAFQAMLETHQPDIWIFGHWHVSFDSTINGTRFVCLAELETKEIEVGLI